MNKEEVYKQLQGVLLDSNKPSEELKLILLKEEIKSLYPFSLITVLLSVPQNPEYHPEGSVWNHVMMVVDEAAKRRHLSDDKASFMWAALLHDLGKATTTRKRKGRLTSYDHDKVGESLVLDFFNSFQDINEDFKYRVSKLTRWHMQALFVIKQLPFADIEKMIREVDIQELALLTLSDRLGRGGISKQEAQKTYQEIDEFLRKVSKVSGVKYEKLTYIDS